MATFCMGGIKISFVDYQAKVLYNFEYCYRFKVFQEKKDISAELSLDLNLRRELS